MNVSHKLPVAITSVVLFITTLCGGCIHPNLPSVRYGTEANPMLQDVGASGFGESGFPNQPFPSGDSGAQEFGPQEHFFPSHGTSEFVDEEFCEGDGHLTDRSGAHHQPKTPEAPWPRFHPLPTRPVLGPSR